MISNDIVLKAEQCLFGNIELSEEFHKKLKRFMNQQQKITHVVVLYKPNKSFRELLESCPELPDIERKEFVVLDSGKLKFSPDYYCKPLQTISINTFITDEIVNKICQYLFGTKSLPVSFVQRFKAFLTDPFWNYSIPGMELCNSNRRFMTFLDPFYYLPDIKMKKLTVYPNGSITFTTDYSRNEPQEISLK